MYNHTNNQYSYITCNVYIYVHNTGDLSRLLVCWRYNLLQLSKLSRTYVHLQKEQVAMNNIRLIKEAMGLAVPFFLSSPSHNP